MDMLKVCKKCRKENEETFHGYIGWVNEDCYECPICQNSLIDTILTIDEYNIVDNISDDVSFLEAMIKLKQKDIIKFQSRMFQFKTQLAQQENNKAKNDNTPKCPICGSANIKKISDLSKAGSVAMWGIFSRKVHKQWHCDHCDSEF